MTHQAKLPNSEGVPTRISRSPRSQAGRFALALAIILVIGLAVAFAADHVVARLALKSHPMTSQLSLAAAMGGLFSGGLAVLLLLLLAIRWTSRTP